MAKPKNKKHAYTEDKIKTLSSTEHIRTRAGMYIGRTGDGSHYDDGIYILLKEVVDNAIDEFIMGHGEKIDISIEESTVSVRDYGRGIPLSKVVDCVSQINTGAKYNDDVFQFSVGLNGVGTKAVNALSSEFLVRSHREKKYMEASFRHGKLENKKKGASKTEPDGTFIRFKPDETIFEGFQFDEDYIDRRLRLYSYLNAGLELNWNGRKYKSEDGLYDLLIEDSEFEKIYEPLHYKSNKLELSFTHTNRLSENHYSFVNGQFTTNGGTHLSAFREGMLKAINEYASGKFAGEDVREGLLGAISVRLRDPVFESQTKNKLSNNEIRSNLVAETKEIILKLLHRNQKQSQKIISKIEETRKFRKQMKTVKQLARKRTKAITIRVPQLKDCKYHPYSSKKMIRKHGESMIFIAEGQSAAGSMVSCRDANTQAIYTLKGKPLNTCNLKLDSIYKNVELFNLMKSLGIEDSVDNLRYHHVVLATDADVDGLHIRNLMITCFLRFFPLLVKRGHLKILETPLFRVRNKKETIYCYSEKERDQALEKLGPKCETTRFKGLGEISPTEFSAFISKDSIRLTSVKLNHEHSIYETISFYMGKNTRQRREYIMDNLITNPNS